MHIIRWICDRTTFRPADVSKVRWLDWDEDYELFQKFWPIPLNREQWERARSEGNPCCILIEGEEIIASAGEKRFSEDGWGVVAVETSPLFRRRGHGKAVVSFVTAHILDSGRMAICETRDDNVAMIRTAESVGYKRSEPSVGR